jgi:hypothetical protein
MGTRLGLTPDEVYSNWGMLAQSGLIAWDKVETITTLAALKELIAKEMSANGELGRRCRVGDENHDDERRPGSPSPTPSSTSPGRLAL